MRKSVTTRCCLLVLIVTAVGVIDGRPHSRSHNVFQTKRSNRLNDILRLKMTEWNFAPEISAGLYASAALICEAAGSSPTMHWLYNGTRIQQGAINAVDDGTVHGATVLDSKTNQVPWSNTVSKLYIDCFTPNMVGLYQCVAETPTDRIAESTMISYDSSQTPDDTTMCTRTGKPARITMFTNFAKENTGDDVQLFCRSAGHPTPVVTWYDTRGRRIRNRKGYQVLDNGDLLIKKFNRKRHDSRYWCNATNSLGTDEVMVSVY